MPGELSSGVVLPLPRGNCPFVSLILWDSCVSQGTPSQNFRLSPGRQGTPNASMAFWLRTLTLHGAWAIVALPAQLRSDTVVLRNGERHTGVRAVVQDNYVNIVTKRGQIRVVPKREVASLVPEPVDWEQDEAQLRARIAKLIQEREQAARARQVEPLSALWRSAILPGWGQLRKGSEFKGFALAGAAALSTVLLYNTTGGHEAAVADRDVARDRTLASGLLTANLGLATVFYAQGLSAQADVERSAATAARVSIFLLAVYAYNLFDAYFADPPLEGGQTKDAARLDGSRLHISADFQGQRSERSVRLAFTQRF